MPLALGVNIDHVATVRQARYLHAGQTHGGNVEPDPVELAAAAVAGGADGITVHLREDRRHIQDEDVLRLKSSLKVPLNLEMAATVEMLKFATDLCPEKVCLVPEKRAELTTEGGLNVKDLVDELTPYVGELARVGIEVSLFIDPDEFQIKAAARIGAPVIELHTGNFGNSVGADLEKAWADLVEGANLAQSLGIRVNAGHGINYQNITRMVTLPNLEELNIGHSIVSRALVVGMKEAVSEMRAHFSQIH